MGPEQQQTSVAQETLNYDYLNEDFELIYHPLVMLAKREIEVEVWDYNNTGSNDLVGSVVVDVLPSFKTKIQVEKFLQPKQKSLQSESEEDDENDSPLGPDNNLGRVIFSVIYMSEQDWVKKLHDDEINKVKEEEEMKLKIELEVKKRQEEENKQLEEQRKIKEKQAEMFSKGYLKFSNISVRDLKKMDTIGKTDPYVVFQLGELQKQTTVAKNTLSYDYKNEEIELEYNSYLNQWTGKADVQVWDYDTLGKNDLIGSVVVDV
ncbi:MAG: hypothetical protein EZS28_050806 [Streblomastix strix]|uniref:C2 domain-containing protein n=1 Tax=Streblomastix strix TaxID=222440 RepID=A0A5J4T601_9EUKA|nr:MAG: hypothetical protein EZS28_050806 [Streblomastix strix]